MRKASNTVMRVPQKLFYIYSYEKTCLKLCDISETHSRIKRDRTVFWGKEETVMPTKAQVTLTATWLSYRCYITTALMFLDFTVGMVCIATSYDLDNRGVGIRILSTSSRSVLGPPSLLFNG
jgi:hypothetical protein